MLIGVGSHAAKAPGRGLRLKIAPPSTAGSTTRGGPAYKSTSRRTQTGRTVSPNLWISTIPTAVFLSFGSTVAVWIIRLLRPSSPHELGLARQ